MRCVHAIWAALVMLLAATPIAADELDAAAGKALFKRQWIPAPSSTDASDGLGPLFNARSCSACHAGGGGAKVVTDADGSQRLLGAVVRLGSPSGATDPFYGLQLQTNAVPGLTPEAEVSFLPKLAVKLLGPPLAPETHMGIRLAPSLFGAADLERVAARDIRSRADPDDTNGDGISGRVRETPDGIGRYGWKASQAPLRGQIAHAFALDIGLSSPLQPFPYGDCTGAETACRTAANGESPLTDNREVSSKMIDLVAEYVTTLKTSKVKPDPDAAAIFDRSGCAQCHVPTLKANDGSLIPAFTDLLLHDMGPDLDDGVGEVGVASSEWRTAPLKKSYPRRDVRRYLHDGSAATVEEAVGKHGGEAAASRDAFGKLNDADKTRLIGYVNGSE
jgi:CxxC motif-containing protein (DUF1111 family)